MAEAPWRSHGQPAVARQPSDRRAEPPLCVQNAMLTKDKKPFTYTPGGIDLSEIGSPRLARRIERNANAPGVGEVQISAPPGGYAGNLPPAAMAAMQPALPVQVFPAGAPPPPPPPPVNIPPPPPMQPLPTKSICTSEGVVERPDMTKIIPENPMALLRKTPKAPSMADNINYAPPQPQPQPNQNNNFASRPQPVQPQPVQRQEPIPQVVPQMVPQVAPQPSPPAPKPQMVQRPPQQQPPQQEMKTSTAQLGSLYIPPIDNQNRPVPQTPQTPRNVSSPPAPPQRTQAQSPSSPQSPMATLQKAPRPWQNQKTPQPEVPAWAQRSQSPPQAPQRASPPAQSPPIQRGPQNVQRGPPSPNVQGNVVGRIIIPVQMDAPPQNTNVEAVYITQPIVLQHPGPAPPSQQQRVNPPRVQQPPQQPQQSQQFQQQRVQQQQATQQRTEQKNIRIIPIQIEGANNNNNTNNVQRQESRFSSGATTPATATPGSARPFNRQPSWSQSGGPTQSNSFKLIQKITNTDGDDDDDEEEVEHEPRNSQQFQKVPTEQVRKMNINDDDRVVNKVKQVPRNGQNAGGNAQQVRMIPVQMEGEPSGNYIPPSEQTVPEPKKYTGGKIPSRSFKILQAMTGDTCGPDQSDL